MVKRTATIEKALLWSADEKKNLSLSDLFISPDYCPLNPGGMDDAPNPNCYEVGIDSYETSLCCYFEGAEEKEGGTLRVRCICPDNPETYERHEYKMVEKKKER